MADLVALTRFCLRAVESGKPVALITQCAVEGSTPRELGVRMAVTEGAIEGTIGGGNLEQLAIDQARRLLHQPERKFLLQDHPLGPLLAQCCGGHVRLLIEALDSADRDWLRACESAASRSQTLQLVTQLTDTSPRKIITETNSTDGGFQFLDDAGGTFACVRPALSQCAALTEQFGRSQPHLCLYGAGHVGRASFTFLTKTIFQVTCFDDREHERALLPQSASVQSLGDVTDLVKSLPPQGFHVVFTHSHDLDYQIVRTVLTKGDFRYLGLIGSQTKRARFIARLERDGFEKEDIARLTCPIGTPGITSKAPEAVAIALAHELLSMLGPDDNPLKS